MVSKKKRNVKKVKEALVWKKEKEAGRAKEKVSPVDSTANTLHLRVNEKDFCLTE